LYSARTDTKVTLRLHEQVRHTGRMAKKMYLTIGLDKEQMEMSHHPKRSPYMQTARLVFARNAKEASAKAKKLLGNPPHTVKQIGVFCADLSGQKLRDGGPGSATDVRHLGVTDCNDTGEGLLVGIGKTRAAKAGGE